MRILVIGGTRFVGRAIVEAATARGHTVTLLHRGTAGSDVLPYAEHLHTDRNEDLSSLSSRSFDVTVDVCAYVPRQVETLAAALGGRGGHHVFISTVSVYDDAKVDGPGLTEDGPLAELADTTTEQVTGETYGGLKVLCERAARSAYGDDRLTVVRPTYVIGPHDPTGRFTWWVRRVAAGGEVLAPAPADAPIQAVDARDQGDWVVRLAEQQTAGTFNSIGTPLPFGFGDLLGATVAAVGPPGTTLTWVDGGWLVEQGENGQSLPLWPEGGTEWTLAADPSRALATGLTPRPIGDTVRDTLDWIRAEDPPMVDGWGITAEREADLLAAWQRRGDPGGR
ncbi:MAG TPA: NAD-dependent epimerase/dehydratase family protein [Nocardioidaceae bacterium]|nr:NAD-dependent epimerase/dehydratase family protein [Nocardioidaceae bacterium]